MNSRRKTTKMPSRVNSRSRLRRNTTNRRRIYGPLGGQSGSNSTSLNYSGSGRQSDDEGEFHCYEELEEKEQEYEENNSRYWCTNCGCYHDIENDDENDEDDEEDLLDPRNIDEDEMESLLYSGISSERNRRHPHQGSPTLVEEVDIPTIITIQTERLDSHNAVTDFIDMNKIGYCDQMSYVEIRKIRRALQDANENIQFMVEQKLPKKSSGAYIFPGTILKITILLLLLHCQLHKPQNMVGML